MSRTCDVHGVLPQNAELRGQLTMGRDTAFVEVQLRNEFLQKKLNELEEHLHKRQRSDTAVNAGVRRGSGR